jgi:hypothetical protein
MEACMKLSLPAAAALDGAQAHPHRDASRCGCAFPSESTVCSINQPRSPAPPRAWPEFAQPCAWRLREGAVMSLN